MRRSYSLLIAASLFLLFAWQLILHASAASPTFDEPTHLVAGLRHLQCRSYAPNPEHPPLVKTIAAIGAAIPIVSPEWPCQSPSWNGYVPLTSIGGDLLASAAGLRSLFRARLAVSIFALILSLLVFAATWEMFDLTAALVALAIFAFEPTLIAHGALVATDMAVTAALFAFSYALYRYARQPSGLRLLVAAICAGLMITSKHSSAVMLPVMLGVFVIDAIRNQDRKVARWIMAAAVIGVVSVTILWATYGFRFAALPGTNSPFSPIEQTLARHPDIAAGPVGRTLSFLDARRLLPEAYLQGLAQILATSARRTFLLGQRYQEGVWFYFPVAFTIKTSLTLLALMVLAAASPAAFRGKGRESLFLIVPAAVYLALAMVSKFNIGIRHILPVYPFIIVLAAAGTAAWMVRWRHRRVIVLALLVFHAAMAAATYPDAIAFANNLWGGPRNTYKVLSDSNVDWGQDALRVAAHARERGGPCWYAHYGSGAFARLTPCSALPSLGWTYTHEKVAPIPPVLQGTVYLTINVIPPRGLQEYELFRTAKPIDQIGGSTLVYEGTFNVPVLSAISFAEYASWLLRWERVDEALAAAQQSVALAPNEPRAHAALAGVLFASGRPDEGHQHLRRASELTPPD